MPHILFDDFMCFAKTLQGQVIPTRAGQATFNVRVTDKDMVFTPRSGKPRRALKVYIERVLEKHARTGSLKNSDYKHITFDASYILTLIDRYIAANDR